jgi:hypothetical protein
MECECYGIADSDRNSAMTAMRERGHANAVRHVRNATTNGRVAVSARKGDTSGDVGFSMRCIHEVFASMRRLDGDRY